MGVWPQLNTDLKHTLGQFPDCDYDLLYAVYKAHADVSACVGIWAGSVTGNGWRLGLMDPNAKPTDAQAKQIDALTLWLKNPNPAKRFSRILYELIEHMAITGDAYLNKVTNGKGQIQELWSVHPATVRIVADIHGDITGYIQRYHGVNVAQFEPNEMSRFQLPSAVNDLYGHSPLSTSAEVWHRYPGGSARKDGGTGWGARVAKKRRAARVRSAMLPARRLAATSSFIRPQMRSTGLASWAAYRGSQSTVTRGLAASQARTTLASWVWTLSIASTSGPVG